MTDIQALDSRKSSEIEALLDTAFGVDRHGRAAYAIRAGMEWIPELSFAISGDDGTLIGLLQSWPVALFGEHGLAQPLVMVGPVAVLPEHQGEGHGRALMDELIMRVDAAVPPVAPLVMIGDPEYYGRFWGFSAENTSGWHVPGAIEQRRLLMRANTNVALPVAGSLGPRRQQRAA